MNKKTNKIVLLVGLISVMMLGNVLSVAAMPLDETNAILEEQIIKDELNTKDVKTTSELRGDFYVGDPDATNAAGNPVHTAEIKAADTKECDHFYQWKMLIEATCIDNGSQKLVCELCGKVIKIEALKQIGHKMKQVTQHRLQKSKQRILRNVTIFISGKR